jgi:uncharacterized protein involved in exopolysaccharide biosynthesis
MSRRQVDGIEFLYVLFQWRRWLACIFLCVCLITVGVSLILPKVYTAETTILPPAEEGNLGGVSSLLNKIPIGGLGLGIGTLPEEASLFIAIINSRTVMESVAQKFDLKP